MSSHPTRVARTPYLSGRPLWSLRTGLDVVDDDGAVRVVGRWEDTGTEVDIVVPAPAPVVREALRRMCLGPVAMQNVAGLDECYRNWKRRRGSNGPWDHVKRVFDDLGGSVVPSLGFDDGAGPALSALAEGRNVVFVLPRLRDATPVGPAPGAAFGVQHGEPVLVAPGAPYRIVLHDPLARDVAAAVVGGPLTVDATARRVGRALAPVRDTALYLVAAGVARADG